MADTIPSIELPQSLLKAIHSRLPSEGLTHNFYRYPARFSPQFARAVLRTLTEPGDVILDPFVGSGTTLVEALVSGRYAIGADINPLAHFLSRVKTTMLHDEDFSTIERWLRETRPLLNLRRHPVRASWWAKAGYQKDLPWPIRKTMEFIIAELDKLPRHEQRMLVRCALLKSGQWALDCTRSVPSASEFRTKFADTLREYFSSLRDMKARIETLPPGQQTEVLCFNTAAAKLEPALWEGQVPKKPDLVVTSPPYPGVHVLYHRWQIRGRRETPAPFWIIGNPDGKGGSYYTMGSRTPTGVDNYMQAIEASFRRIHSLLAVDGKVVQLLAFSDIDRQLPRYLRAMREAGFREMSLELADGNTKSRISRRVPLRRWYASLQGKTPSSREFLFVHKRVADFST